MRRMFTIVAALFLSAALTQAAWLTFPVSQWPVIWYAHQNAAFLYIDSPTPGAWGTPTDHFAGWAFNCNGSQPQIVVWRFNLNGGFIVGVPSYAPVRDARVVTGLYRPDVARAYRKTACVVSEHAGFHVYFPSGHPQGAQAYLVQAYSEGGTWNPKTGAWANASHWQQLFVIIREGR